MKAWIRAIGFYRGFLLVSFVPTSLGAAVAFAQTSGFSWGLFALTMLAVWCSHAGTNLLNDYYDHVSGTDDINEVRTPFSGGTRVIQENMLPAWKLKIAAVIFFGLGAVLFFILVSLTGWPLLLLVVFGLASGWFYTWRPVWLAYRGFGELFILLNFGPALVWTGYYTQLRSIDLTSLTIGLIVGLWAAAIITINEVPDYVADKTVGKNNLVVRFGPALGVKLWATLLYVALALLVGGVFTGILPRTAALAMLATPLIIRLTDRASRPIEEIGEVAELCGGTIKSEIAVWALLLVALIVTGLQGWA